jgi:hypothetical protein
MATNSVSFFTNYAKTVKLELEKIVQLFLPAITVTPQI